MADVVLDSSTVIALIRMEVGAGRVVNVLDQARICAVNLAEIISVLINKGAAPEAATERVAMLPLKIVAFDHALAIRTGTLGASTAHRGLSLGDRACLALAEREGLPALTADRAWSELDIGVEIRLLR